MALTVLTSVVLRAQGLATARRAEYRGAAAFAASTDALANLFEQVTRIAEQLTNGSP